MTTETKADRNGTDWVEAIGKPAYESIAEMVAALQCDYERLEELREERADLVSEAEDDTNAVRKESRKALKAWDTENGEELAELTAAAGDCESEEQARERIQEDPLSLQVRSGWHSPGEESEAEEFELLLGTGGPAVRIIGELDDGEPDHARLQVQDWSKPWTEYTDVDRDVLLAYCRVFYFGE